MTAAFRIKLTIPCLPDLDLSSNRRRSRVWQAQARDTAAERERAQVMLLESAAGQYQAIRTPVILRWTLYWPKGIRSRDADSYASLLKPWQDALVDLRWLPGDSLGWVSEVCYRGVPSSPKGPSMRLVVEPAAKER